MYKKKLIPCINVTFTVQCQYYFSYFYVLWSLYATLVNTCKLKKGKQITAMLSSRCWVYIFIEWGQCNVYYVLNFKFILCFNIIWPHIFILYLLYVLNTGAVNLMILNIIEYHYELKISEIHIGFKIY